MNQRTKTAVLRATKTINKGEEMYVAYGRAFWTEEAGKNKKERAEAAKKREIIDVSAVIKGASSGGREGSSSHVAVLNMCGRDRESTSNNDGASTE